MIIKKTLISIASVSMLFLFVGNVSAQTITIPPDQIKYTVGSPVMGSASGNLKANPTRAAGKVDNLQTRAQAEIQRRITSLTELSSKISSIKRLSATQKTSLTTQIQSEITSLNTLQAKIKADTDPAVLKADVQSIVTSYRVYALFMPQIRLLTASSVLMETADKMSSLSANLQTRITAAQAAGANVSSMQASLTDMNAKIADANIQGNAIIASITPLTPAGFPGNKTILQAAQAKLQTGITDLKTAGLDARQIIQGLLVAGSGDINTSSNSASKQVAPQESRMTTPHNPEAPL